MSRPAFTVFTATYNRAHTLPRVYASLVSQTCTDFEWLIVDDGSSDGTEDLVRRWQAEAGFPVSYVFQENRGKHHALNRGVQEANGELFVILDSDDEARPDALRRMLEIWKSIPDATRDEYCGVNVECEAVGSGRTRHRELVGPVDATLPELFYRYGVRHDIWGAVLTSVLKVHPFPDLDGARFVPEGLVWREIGRHRRTRYVQEPFLIIHDAGSDRLSVSSIHKNTVGLRELHRFYLNRDIEWFPWAPLEFVRSAFHYARFSWHNQLGVAEQVAGVDGLLARCLVALCCVPARLWVFRDRLRFGRAEGS
jgi:glycosyltransferase involved in cell wall biosynthesis